MNFDFIDLSHFDPAAVMALLADAACKGAVILAAAWLLTRLMGRRSAAQRHLVWSLAVFSILALPALGMLLPAWRILPPWMGPAPLAKADLKREPIKHSTGADLGMKLLGDALRADAALAICRGSALRRCLHVVRVLRSYHGEFSFGQRPVWAFSSATNKVEMI